jgi:hypothetical protein
MTNGLNFDECYENDLTMRWRQPLPGEKLTFDG